VVSRLSLQLVHRDLPVGFDEFRSFGLVGRGGLETIAGASSSLAGEKNR